MSCCSLSTSCFLKCKSIECFDVSKRVFDLFGNIVLSPGEVLNFHIDDLTNCNPSELLNLLDTFNMSQHVSEPTHQSGHMLDLLITRQD